MSIEENKALVQRFLDEVVNGGKLEAIPDFFVRGSMLAGGIEGQQKVVRAAFPDGHTTVEDMFAEGNSVTVRVTNRGTNTGPLLGLPGFGPLEPPLPPTGKSVMMSGLLLFTIGDGKIKSVASEVDGIGLLRQLGWTFTPPAAR